MKTTFNFYGVTLSLESDQSNISFAVILRLTKDFNFFKNDDVKSCFSTIILYGEKAPNECKPQGHCIFKTKMSNVYGLGQTRICDYGNDSSIWSENLKSKRTHKIYSENGDLMYEMAYTTILSVIGEALDNLHLHRLHALGVRINNQAGILLLPSGGGKSSIGLLIQKHAHVKIYSDESPLVKDHTLYPFPIRIAIRPHLAEKYKVAFSEEDLFNRKIFDKKVLIPIPNEHVAPPDNISFVLIGVGAKEPGFKPCSRFKLIRYLFTNFVVGIGIAQMAEHMLRLSNIPNLIMIAFSRLKTTWLISKINSRYIFEMSPDMNLNCETLIKTSFAQKDITRR